MGVGLQGRSIGYALVQGPLRSLDSDARPLQVQSSDRSVVGAQSAAPDVFT